MVMCQTIGAWQGVSIDVAAWDSVAADVDLSFACMFTHEMHDGPGGGLRHLDDALSGRLVQWRGEGVFLGDFMETLLIDRPPAAITARAVMVIGMGEPLVWTTTATARAVAHAVRTAMQLGAASAAFAPSLLDAGLTHKATECAASVMLKAVTQAIDAQVRIAASGLAPPPSLRRWVFDVGASGYAATAQQFQATLTQLQG